MPGQQRNFSKSASRAIEVLCYLEAVGAPARASDIAKALGIARSSADQLLKTMVSAGHLVVTAQNKTYFPSLLLTRLGRWLANCYPSAPALRSLVLDVHERTGNITTITIETDCFMQIMEASRTSHLDRDLTVGVKVPVIGTTIGGAALTTKTSQEIRRILSRAHHNRAILGEPGPIRNILDDVRDYRLAGYCSGHTPLHVRRFERDGLSRDWWSIALPLPAHRNGASVVLGLSGPVKELRPREGQVVQTMRDAISRHLNA